jgi:hypothetical protein
MSIEQQFQIAHEAATKTRTQLTTLRISVARVAQALGVNDPTGLLIRQSMSYGELADLAATREHGWNHLCALLVERANELTPGEEP